jgi:hypothetical protein
MRLRFGLEVAQLIGFLEGKGGKEAQGSKTNQTASCAILRW